MCVTHGMPCVNMHGTFEAYIYGELKLSVWGRAARRRRRKGKEKKKGEKERKTKEEKEGVLRSEQTRTAKNPELRYKR